MYLFLTSIREKTTDIAKWQAERLGFKVILAEIHHDKLDIDVSDKVRRYKEYFGERLRIWR